MTALEKCSGMTRALRPCRYNACASFTLYPGQPNEEQSGPLCYGCCRRREADAVRKRRAFKASYDRPFYLIRMLNLLAERKGA